MEDPCDMTPHHFTLHGALGLDSGFQHQGTPAMHPLTISVLLFSIAQSWPIYILSMTFPLTLQPHKAMAVSTTHLKPFSIHWHTSNSQ
jgi:hypothetical protein